MIHTALRRRIQRVASSHQIAVISVALFLAFPRLSLARTWHVNYSCAGNGASIQTAIDNAQGGDTILVGPGVFREALVFRGRDVTVTGAGMYQTVVDANGLEAPCAQFIAGESNETVLSGMTLTGGTGKAYGNARIGGGVLVDDAEPTLRNLCVRNNSAVGTVGSYGGGIHIFGRDWINIKSPIIDNCEIAFNTALGNGGGVGFSGLSAPVIRDCNIHDNIAVNGDGGGIWGRSGIGTINIRSNSIILNRAGDHGGGVYMSGTPNLPLTEVFIVGNLVAENIATGRDSQDITGGGLWLSYLFATIENNTIVHNAATGGGGIVAGSVGLMYSGNYRIGNNIIAYTTSGYAIVCDLTAIVSINDNISWMNWGSGRFGCEDWVHGGGNAEVDPLFCVDGKDFSVQEQSPALTNFTMPVGWKMSPGCRGTIMFTTWGAIKSRF